ncbi:MAG: DEAD/DEAH box helicase family protein [Oscillospiraceae bacterium]|nr:DEAD/DEAH box helicase family protein [Oscillospiraceae bacterium]
MPSKLQLYSQLADQTARQLTGSLQAWTGFLTTAARLYKYPYHEQLMIYAQRPEATACADYELWNKTMHRYVRRGSQGIALIDASGDNPRLKYVFDISDTGGGAQSRRPYLWEYRDEHHDAVTAALERRFAVSADGGLADQLETISAQLVNEYWQDNRYDILGIVDGSFLSEYDDDNVGAAFRNAAAVSATYALLSRCGLEPEESFTHEDFLSVFDFNTPSTVAALGTAISQTSERVLRQIEVTIKNYEREKCAERKESHDKIALSEQRGLPDPGPDADRAGAGSETPGQVREDAEALPAGASPSAVESDAPARDAVPAPAGDRRGGEQPSGADAPGAGEGGGRDRGAESRRPAEMDRPDERLQSPGGGDDSERTDLQLSEQPPIVAAEQISLFPTEAEQMEIIMEAESATAAPFAFSLPQEDIATEKAAVGADSSRAFSEVRPEAATPTPPKREITQNEIDAVIRAWNGSIQSKHAVVRHMELHGREKQTAEWLAMEYHARADQPFHISMDGAELDLSWPKVQRRIAQLIQADRFYTQEEYDNLDDVDPIAAREHLAQAGIVNGEVVDPEALNRDPFLQQVMADAERLAPKEAEDRDTGTPEPKEATNRTPYKVGDTVYLEDTAYEITAVRNYDVELRDPTQVYPIFRAESRDRFEIALYQDPRNSFLTDYLPLDLNIADGDLQDVLTRVGGLFGQRDKETISSWFRAGESNPRIAQRLSDTCAGQSNTVTMQTGEDADFFATPSGVEIHIQDKYSTRHHFSWGEIARVLRAMYQQEQFGFLHGPANTEPAYHEETTAFYPGERNGLPFDVEIRTLRFDEPEHDPPAPIPPAENFRILDEHLGEGGPKEKFWRNIQAITTLKQIEGETRQATPEEQHILSQYVGWGGLADAFDPEKSTWAAEYSELKGLLTDAEYTAARGSTLNAHYTSPTVIRAIYEAVGNMGFQTGNILEPSLGVGNFFGMLPEEMRSSRLYGVELDSISGRMAKQLYPKANITVAGFETTDRRDFYDLAVGNVPFGQYQVDDRAYNKLGFSIHNYFFAKALDQVRPGGVVAFVTSRYTMDAKDPTVRKYLAQRADLLGAIRLPNNAFRANAGTDVVSDILFLQKRDHPIDIEPEWVHLDENDDGFSINNYFVEHPEMILGRQSSASTQYGHQDFTVLPIEGQKLSDQLHDAIRHIHGHYQEAELPELGEGEEVSETLPADPDMKNYSFTVVDGEVYYRENSIMVKPDLNATAKERVRGMVELRDCVRSLIDLQMDEYTPDSAITEKQAELNRRYDAFTAKYGLINDRGNRLAFDDDDSYYLLCSLEVLDENGALERKADFFTRRTIRQQHSVDHVDTAVEALGVSIGERASVDLPFMAALLGGQDKIPQIVEDLRGVLFKDPSTGPLDYAEGGEHWAKGWQTADEYLSGNVRRKLRQARRAAEQYPEFRVNVEALEKAQPRDLEASEIEVRLGTTWIDKSYIQEFMYDLLDTPFYLQRRIQVHYSPYTAEWQIEGKSNIPSNNIAAYTTYGTDRASAYRLLEDALNLRDTRVYDTVTDPDGRERRVLNARETTLAAQKQQLIKDAFKDWIWKDPERRAALVKQYNEEMNSTRPREYDGSHIVFSGMNPEITLRPHQRDAIAHILYGGNTLLAHEVGAGKTFEMVAAAMESKRLGLCSKSIFVVPNHLTDQWAAEFLRLYPSANILVTTKKDFQKRGRKKFCARIATGDYDAVIIGHSQFEKIPISPERQMRLIEEQIEEITKGIEEVKENNGERFTIKELERTKKGLEARLKKLQDADRKDDVVTFEQLGVDRMFVDESDNYKNLFLYTKMRNVAGLSTTDAQKSSDMFAKCRYMDELTGGRGVVFATGTPVSNSMTELYTIQRYLQYDRLQELGMGHFDCWASRFGETTTALELAPEGTGYRARTRFARFFNLPELMNMFKEVADIKTADQLHLPTPEVEYHNYVSRPTEIQKEMVKDLSERASRVHSGAVDAHVDNMLKITSDGRKLGLDQRILNPMLPDEEGTKVNQCVGNILKFWRDGEADKLTQLVFCDISTPKGRTATEKAAKAASGNLDSPEIHALETLIPLEEKAERSFTIYEDLRQKLMAGGMLPEQIAFIHDADTEVRKRELFARVRSGQVRVLIGSTQKMGAGTNVQDRLIALHDLDCPWRPRDLTQRKGRIERQGNRNKQVHVCRYVTEGTFDAYLWQTVENKQKFISQIMTSKSPVRSCEDVDETALSFAEIKALCAGDPRIKERMDLDVEVSRLKIMKADHKSKQFRLEDRLLKYFPEQIERNKGFIRGFQEDMKTLAAHPLPREGFVGMVIRGDKLTDKENAGAALIDAVKEVKLGEPVEIGSYRGFSMSVEFSSFTKQFMLTLKGAMSHRVELGEDPRGNLTRIENALAKMPERLAAVEAQLDNLYQQQAAAKVEVGKPFPYEADLSAKTARLVELDLQLNLNGGEPQPQPEQTVARRERPSILERLKQPLPQRAGDKRKTHTLETSL